MMTRISDTSHTSHNPLQTAILGTLGWKERGVKNLGQPGCLHLYRLEGETFHTEKKA